MDRLLAIRPTDFVASTAWTPDEHATRPLYHGSPTGNYAFEKPMKNQMLDEVRIP